MKQSNNARIRILEMKVSALEQILCCMAGLTISDIKKLTEGENHNDGSDKAREND